ncbi:MAG: TRAP transporter large permease subunit [Dehalococcoidia bacterium]|nr:MAG: TRAP transporter large permease subunit [Dehalococcoidia bacterium]
MSPLMITLLMLGGLMATLLTGRQIFLLCGGIGTAAALAIWGTGGEDMAFFGLMNFLNWYVIIAIPMFLFMGNILARSGMADIIYEAMHKWFAGLRGGLGIGTIGMTTVIAAMAGTNITGTVTAGLLGIRPMLKRGYDKRMVTGLIQAGGALGMMIPPSIDFILFAIIAQGSVGHLWIAGIIPGLILALMYVAYIGIRCRLQPHLGPALPPEERATWGEKFRALGGGIQPVLIIFTVLGLLFMGVTTLMECGAVGAVGSVIVAAANRRLSWKVVQESLDETLKISCIFLWIFGAAVFFSAVYDGLGAPALVGQLLGQFGHPLVIIGMMMLTWFGLGMIMDDTAMLVIVAPLYIPLVKELGFSITWFGCLFVMSIQMAVLTPPFGYGLFMMKGIVPKDSGITLGDIYRSVWPFVAIQAGMLVLLMFFPQICLWLPYDVFGFARI